MAEKKDKLKATKRVKPRHLSGAKTLRHTKAPRKLEIGVAAEDFIEQREAVYEQMFGKNVLVSHEFLALIPHIDVYIYKPVRAKRRFYTLVTGGMSDERMNVPKLERSACRRTEIIFYVNKPRDAYVGLLRFLARLPFEFDTWFGPWHTIPNGNPPEPLFPGSKFCAAVFLDSPVDPEKGMVKRFRIRNDSVKLLWLVPLTKPEYQLALEMGIQNLLKVFKKKKHPIVFDPKRPSYV
jgi:hypothetical protein